MNKKIGVAQLKVNPDNPRTITEAQLANLKKSLEKFGDLSGIVHNRRSGFLVGGHQRLKVLPAAANVTVVRAYPRPTKAGTTAEGFIEVFGERFLYRQVDWDQKTERAANIAANKHGGEWDFPKLAKWLEELQGQGVDLATIGVSLEEFEKLVGNDNGKHGCDEDEVPDPPKKPVSRLGDLFILGDHRLVCGDATDPEIIKRLMKGDAADVVFTDPPYNVDYDPEERKSGCSAARRRKPLGKIKNDKMAPEAFRTFLDAVFGNYNAILRAGAPIYICHADTQGHHFRLAFIGQQWKLQSCLIWKKTSLVLGRTDYHWMHEPILYGWKEGASHRWCGDRKQTSILEFPTDHCNQKASDTKGYVHPTQKPVALIERALLNSSRPSAIVADFFGGSGSTLITAEKIKRRARLAELDPKFCDVIITRWEKYSGKKARRISR